MTILLKINHFVFSCYYSRVDEHFRQWTLFRSISLLIQNYNHQRDWWESDKKHLSDVIAKNDVLHKQIRAYQWKELGADPTTTMRLNNMFGTDMPTGNEN